MSKHKKHNGPVTFHYPLCIQCGRKPEMMTRRGTPFCSAYCEDFYRAARAALLKAAEFWRETGGQL